MDVFNQLQRAGHEAVADQSFTLEQVSEWLEGQLETMLLFEFALPEEALSTPQLHSKEEALPTPQPHSKEKALGVALPEVPSMSHHELEDDHHTPLTPEQYLRLRVHPLVGFYQERLPVYSQIRWLHEILRIAGTLGGTLLAFVGYAHWSAVGAAIVTATMAYSKFHATETKIMRYSNVVAAIHAITLWWMAMTPVERGIVSNIDFLVESCENAFQGERQAWVSTKMNMKLLANENDEDRDDGDHDCDRCKQRP